MSVHVHIDRLVVEGLGPLDGEALASAVRAALAARLAAAPPSVSTRRLRADGGAFPLVPGASAEAIAAHLSQRLFSTLQSDD